MDLDSVLVAFEEPQAEFRAALDRGVEVCGGWILSLSSALFPVANQRECMTRAIYWALKRAQTLAEVGRSVPARFLL